MSRSMPWTDRPAWAAVPLLVSLLWGCGHDSAASTALARPSFAVATPKLADTSFEREYVGEVQAVRYAEIRSRLKGLIESVSVDEGQSVKTGQQLFSIAASELQQELLKARAATKSAEAELKSMRLEQENTRMLFEKKVVSNAEMALADSKVEALQARVEESKANANQMAISLTYAKVRAPFDGVVNRIPHKVGSVVSEDDLLTTLADTSEVFVYFRVSEREYLEYASRLPDNRAKDVTLKLADGTAHPGAGVIDAVENEVSRDTGNLAFRARFPNPAGLLKHGSSGKVVIRTNVPGALLVPQKSTFEVQGRLFVYSVDANNTTRAREIVPKHRVGDSFVVASGLTSQDRFILEGVQKVKEGMRVDVVPPG
jgi:membrane fusion protein, multidrug efflux system